MRFLVSSSLMAAAALVGFLDPWTTAWVIRVEGRVAALRGVESVPPLAVDALVGPGSHRPPPVGPLASRPAIEAFGLGDPDAVRSSLEELAARAAADGAGGLVRGGAEGASEVRRRVEVARAVVRALLARHHGLAAAAPPDDDAALARSALLEGEVRWIAAQVIAAEAAAIADSLQEGEDVAAVAALDRAAALAAAGAPSVVRRWWWLQGEAGESFVRAVQAAGGWGAVDAAVRVPPTSTEQLLHPRRAYLGSRDEPRRVELAPLLPRLPAGASVAAEGVLGEHFTGEFVRLAGDPARAVRVADGWDGDRYRVFSCDGRLVLQWDAVFDTEEDAEELVDALRKVLQRRYHRAVVGDGFVVAADPDLVRVAATGPDGGVRSCAIRDGDRVRWVDAGPADLDAARLLETSDD